MAKADETTVWPEGFDPVAAGVIFENPFVVGVWGFRATLPSDTMETAISNLTARSIASSPIWTFAATCVRKGLRF